MMLDASENVSMEVNSDIQESQLYLFLVLLIAPHAPVKPRPQGPQSQRGRGVVRCIVTTMPSIHYPIMCNNYPMDTR